jgi:hypothetical protein
LNGARSPKTNLVCGSLNEDVSEGGVAASLDTHHISRTRRCPRQRIGPPESSAFAARCI